MVQLLDTTLDFGTNSLDSRSVARQLDIVVVVRRSENWPLTRARCTLGWMGNPRLVRGDSDLNTSALFQTLGEAVVPAGNEWVELSRHALDLGVNVRRSLSSNLVDFIPGKSTCMRVALKYDINGCVVVAIVNGWLTFFDLGELDAGTTPLLDPFDGRATLSNDVSTR